MKAGWGEQRELGVLKRLLGKSSLKREHLIWDLNEKWDWVIGNTCGRGLWAEDSAVVKALRLELSLSFLGQEGVDRAGMKWAEVVLRIRGGELIRELDFRKTLLDLVSICDFILSGNWAIDGFQARKWHDLISLWRINCGGNNRSSRQPCSLRGYCRHPKREKKLEQW